jgi:hypothetical protein
VTGALPWIVAAAAGAIAALMAWLRSRDRRAATADAWRERAGQEQQRAAGAEAVADEVGAGALRTQTELEKEIHDRDQARVDDPDGGARRRVQGRWAAGGPGGADVPAGPPAAVRDGAAGGAGPGSAGGAAVRGRR